MNSTTTTEKWAFAVGEYLMVRTRRNEDECLKVEQRRMQYGEKAYRMEDGCIYYERQLTQKI